MSANDLIYKQEATGTVYRCAMANIKWAIHDVDWDDTEKVAAVCGIISMVNDLSDVWKTEAEDDETENL